jgi:transcriptional regulator with XRE-family HTH domain
MARAIRRFRSALGDTQQQFATRLGLSVTSIARYETGWYPKERILALLAEVAHREKFPVFAAIFERELPAKADPLLPDEILALQKLITDEFTHQEMTAETARRLRFAFASLRVPTERFNAIEQIIRGDLAADDELIENRAGGVVGSRNDKDEAKYAEFLGSQTEQSAEAYLRSLHTHTVSLEGLADAVVNRFRAILASGDSQAARLYLEKERAAWGAGVGVAHAEKQGTG